MSSQGAGRHPDATRVVVRLTEDAIADLSRLNRRHHEAVRWCLKKMLLLERDPEAGEPLMGGLIGFRKLTVGDRHWRVVWRVAHDAAGATVVDVAEVWAAGARAEAEVYEEMQNRVARLGTGPKVRALEQVLTTLGKASAGLRAASEPGEEREPVPPWLADALVGKGVPRHEIALLSPEEAFARWNTIISEPR